MKLTQAWIFLSRKVPLKLIIKAKLVWIMVFALVLNASAASIWSNETKMTVKLKDAPILKLFEEIEEKSHYRFFYSNDEIDVNQKISVNANDKVIGEILTMAFQNLNYNFRELKDNMILVEYGSRVQDVVISGKVTDSSGEELIGVTVLEKGTTNGAITDVDGNYSINVASQESVLIFSYVGFATQEIIVGTQTTIDVQMQDDLEQLEEVVIIGYGTARRKDLTGAVNSVRIEDSPIGMTPNVNTLSMLRGVSPGLNVGAQNSAGEEPSLIMRGQNSINGTNNPLIVLDGILYYGSINDINPNDIASFDVLRDASSTAIYGSRAANGVIIINTKRGKTTKPSINFSSSVGVNVYQHQADLESPESYLARGAIRNGVDSWEEGDFLGTFEVQNAEAGRTTDWIDAATRAGVNRKYSIDVSGNDDTRDMNYFLSAGYLKQEGIILGDDFEQYTLRAKFETTITDWLKTSVDGSFSFQNRPGQEARWDNVLDMTPYGNVWYDQAAGIYEKYPGGGSNESPVFRTDESRRAYNDDDYYYRLAGYFNLDAPFLEGLSYKFNYSIDYTNFIRERFTNERFFVDQVPSGTEDPGDRYDEETYVQNLSAANGYKEIRNFNSYVLDNILNFRRQFGEHYIDVTAVYTRDQYTDVRNRVDGIDFEANGNTLLGVDGLHKASTQITDINITERANVGYLGRLMYTYRDRYSLTASIRRDGASVFGSDNTWGTFSSVGLAWTISDEPFMSSFNTLNYLRLKTSYGTNGNQGAGPYTSLANVENGLDGDIEYQFGDDPTSILYGIDVVNLANNTLGWEKTTAFNFGLESRFLNNRISLNADFYFSKTEDQIFVREIPIMTSFQSILSSIGQIDNRGIELTLTSTNIDKQDFTWTSTLLYWQNRNEVAELYGDDIDGDGVEDDDLANALFIGRSLGAIYGYRSIGIVQEDDTDYIDTYGANPGDVKFMDISGPDGVPDGVIDATYDRTILGFEKERFRLSIANTLTYKNFQLYFLFSGIFGGGKENFYMQRNTEAFAPVSNFYDRELNVGYWTAENRSNTYPRPGYFNDRFTPVLSRNFLRLQDVSLSYSFKQPWVERMNINSFRVYVSAQNVLLFTDWVGSDPEIGNEDIASEIGNGSEVTVIDTLPVPSIYSFGFDISF